MIDYSHRKHFPRLQLADRFNIFRSQTAVFLIRLQP